MISNRYVYSKLNSWLYLFLYNHNNKIDSSTALFFLGASTQNNSVAEATRYQVKNVSK